MDPYDEQTLRNEVTFLHSLWHQGPPPPPQHHHQRPSEQRENFKKMKTQHQIHASASEWPCPSTNSSNSAIWPSFKATLFPSEADIHFSDTKVQSWEVGNRMQLKVVQEVKKFFKNQKEESDDDEVDDDDDDHDEDMEVDSDEEDEYLEFFLKLFQENVELREFYVENYGNGEFGCLVCGGVGFIRRFKDCVALVQHTGSISKTKKIKAHRAFGKVVCEVLGWDINKLPYVVSAISEKKNARSSKIEEEKLTIEDHNVESRDKETGEKEFVGSSKLEEDQHEVQEKLAIEDHNVESRDKETREKEFAGAEQLPDNGALAVTEIVKDGDSVASELKENVADTEQENKTGSQNCLEVVCEVVGCDISKLPSIASAISENKNAASSCVLEEEHHEEQENLNIEVTSITS